MKLSTILGSLLACTFVVASTAQAADVLKQSAAGICRGRTAAQGACFDGNNEGWLWYSYVSGNSTCTQPTVPLVCGLVVERCQDMTKTMRVTVDGNCSSAMNCTLRGANQIDGSPITSGGLPLTKAVGPGNASINFDVPCTTLSLANYATIQCDVPIGCKIWGVTTQEQ